MQSDSINQVIRRINWSDLRNQKEQLLTTNEHGGILHLIDVIQDAAVSDGFATEIEVFGNVEHDPVGD